MLEPLRPSPYDGLNDALMRSLPELARETGIPMPVILRLKREHPEDMPSIGSGSQQFFPEGVVPVLQELYSREARPPDSGEGSGRREMLSIVGQRRAAQETASRAQEVAPKPKPRRRQSRKTPKDFRDSLGRRLERLEERQRELTAELTSVVARLSRPGKAILPLP